MLVASEMSLPLGSVSSQSKETYLYTHPCMYTCIHVSNLHSAKHECILMSPGLIHHHVDHSRLFPLFVWILLPLAVRNQAPSSCHPYTENVHSGTHVISKLLAHTPQKPAPCSCFCLQLRDAVIPQLHGSAPLISTCFTEGVLYVCNS